MTSPHWRLELREDGKKWRWRLIYAYGLEPNGAPFMEADRGQEKSRDEAVAAARETWERIRSVEIGEPVSWGDE